MTIVVKIGGKPAEEASFLSSLASDTGKLAEEGHKVLLVHGGGVTISALQKKFGITPRFNDGIRETAPDEMPLIDMALAGEVNKRIVRIFRTKGVNAFGFCGADGGVITAESTDKSPQTNRTGKVVSVDISPVEHLWKGSFLPVMAPPSLDSKGMALNINADEAALSVAEALKADFLIFISDVPGVLENRMVIKTLTPDLIRDKIESRIIGGGMIPKVNSAVEALEKGVKAVCISDFTGCGDLEKILNKQRGTIIERLKDSTEKQGEKHVVC